jgi:ferredoxin/flavodoxin
MNIQLFYFSGTGNSLYVAKELKRILPEITITPIIRLLRSDNLLITSDYVGFIFPIQGFTLAYTVKEFIQKAQFDGCKYFFSIATKGGSPDRAMQDVSALLRIKNKVLNAHFSITMFTNDCMFKCPYSHKSFVPTEKMIHEMQNKIENKVKLIADVIKRSKNHLYGDEDYVYDVNPFIINVSLLFLRLAGKHNLKKAFYVDDKCTSCGACVKACPSNRIKIVDSQPFWNDDIYCHRCYACLNYCPPHAIQVTKKWYKPSFTTEQDRYSHPFATLNEIIEQKV